MANARGDTYLIGVQRARAIELRRALLTRARVVEDALRRQRLGLNAKWGGQRRYWEG